MSTPVRTYGRKRASADQSADEGKASPDAKKRRVEPALRDADAMEVDEVDAAAPAAAAKSVVDPEYAAAAAGASDVLFDFKAEAARRRQQVRNDGWGRLRATLLSLSPLFRLDRRFARRDCLVCVWGGRQALEVKQGKEPSVDLSEPRSVSTDVLSIGTNGLPRTIPYDDEDEDELAAMATILEEADMHEAAQEAERHDVTIGVSPLQGQLQFSCAKRDTGCAGIRPQGPDVLDVHLLRCRDVDVSLAHFPLRKALVSPHVLGCGMADLCEEE